MTLPSQRAETDGRCAPRAAPPCDPPDWAGLVQDLSGYASRRHLPAADDLVAEAVSRMFLAWTRGRRPRSWAAYGRAAVRNVVRTATRPPLEVADDHLDELPLDSATRRSVHGAVLDWWRGEYLPLLRTALTDRQNRVLSALIDTRSHKAAARAVGTDASSLRRCVAAIAVRARKHLPGRPPPEV